MLEIRPLSPSLAKRAEKELGENPSQIENCVKELREWIFQQPHLKARTDDQFLVAFLRGSKYDMDLAKQKIDLFFTMRTLVPEITQNRDIRYGTIADVIKLGTSTPLPITSGDDGPRIFLICPGRYDPKKIDIAEIFKLYVLFTDYLMMEDDNFIVSGQIGILDFTNVTSEHLNQYKPDLVKKLMLLCQDSAPYRAKAFHYINTPDGFDFVFNMFKSFMSEENRKLLYVHGSDFESLYRHIPRRFLPTEYGGEAGSIQSLTAHWEQKFLDIRPSILEWDKYGTNELLRPGAPVTEETLLSIDTDTNGFIF